MPTIRVNGVTVECPEGSSVSVINGEVFINDVRNGDLSGAVNGATVEMRIDGNTGNINCNRGSVSVTGNVSGYVDAGGSVNCGPVGSYVDAGGSVTCDNVGGHVDAGGSVTCGDVTGDVDTGGSVNCGNVGGNIDATAVNRR